jgi:hypothetical protein
MTKPKPKPHTSQPKAEPMSPYHRAQIAFAKQKRVLELALSGKLQREIAAVVGMSQRGVGLMLQRLREEGLFDPDAAQVTARQVSAAEALDVPVPAAAKKRRAPGAGRPPAGEEGRAVSDLPRLTLTLPVQTISTLRALALVRGVTVWRLVELGISLIEITPEEAKLASVVAEREMARLHARFPKAW